MKHRTHEPSEVEQIRAQALVLQALQDQVLASKPVWAQLRWGMDKARMLSTVPSSGISEYTTKGKTEGSAPPAQQETTLDDALALVVHAVKLYVDRVRAESGGGASTAFSQMSREEKDRELLKWRGVKAWAVCTYAPWLGETPRTIERARERLGVRSSNGLPLEGEQKRRWEERQAA